MINVLNVDEKSVVINKKRILWYCDFATDFVLQFFDYYMPESFDNDDNDNYFKWCFNKTCERYSNENIVLTENKKLFDFLYDLFNRNLFNTSVGEIPWTCDSFLIYFTIKLSEDYMVNDKNLTNGVGVNNIIKKNDISLYDNEIYFIFDDFFIGKKLKSLE